MGVLPVLFAKVPPAPPSDHTADVAPPPNDPPNAKVVPPWQIDVTAPPTLTVGSGFTVVAMLLLVTDPPIAQGAFDVITTVITWPFVRPDVEYVDPVCPEILSPFNCH